ncbi:MAG: SCO family protein [Rhizobium sp.]|nr:SCO family protein [Rhizobium sp.]
MKTFRIVISVLALIMAALFVWLWFAVGNQNKLVAEKPWGVPFTLVSQDGQPITEKAFQNGTPTALFFGFTHCPEICPTTVYELTGWMKTVDPDKTKLQAYFVTIDPRRDTRELLNTYLSNASDRIVGISGDPDKVETMARGFKVFFEKVPSDAKNPDGPDYTMNHSASVFLLDGSGRFVGTIDYGENPDVAVQKLKNLIARSS